MSKRLQIAGWASLAVFLLSLLVFIGYFVATNQPPAQQNTALNPQVGDEEIADALEALVEQDEAEQEEQSAGFASAALDSARDNGNEFAVATRTFNGVSNSFDFEIVATLGDPQTGNTYTVSVSDGSKSVELGTLLKEVENTYSLSASSAQDIADMNTVIVTETGQATENALKGTFE